MSNEQNGSEATAPSPERLGSTDVAKEADEIVSAICRDVLARSLNDAHVKGFHVTNLDMDKPEDCLTVAACALATE